MKKKGKKAKKSTLKGFIVKSWYNKYLLSMVMFLVWVTFFDKNNLYNQYRLSQNLEKLEEDKIELEQKLETALVERENLKNNKERYAREKYFVKKDNEEVFIIEKK